MSRIDLWYVVGEEVPDALLGAYRALCTDEERARADRYYFDRDRREFLVTRALVRTVLSTYAAAVEPSAWRFTRNRYDRPRAVPELPGGLDFNLSNSHGLVVCAVGRGELGVDVEPFARATTILDVKDSVFSPAELADLDARTGEARERRAVELWTSKEAYVKARAIGLSLPLKGFSVFGGALRFHGIDDRAERWSIAYATPVATHLVAVCAERGERTERATDGSTGEITLRRTVPLA